MWIYRPTTKNKNSFDERATCSLELTKYGKKLNFPNASAISCASCRRKKCHGDRSWLQGSSCDCLQSQGCQQTINAHENVRRGCQGRQLRCWHGKSCRQVPCHGTRGLLPPFSSRKSGSLDAMNWFSDAKKQLVDPFESNVFIMCRDWYWHCALRYRNECLRFFCNKNV